MDSHSEIRVEKWDRHRRGRTSSSTYIKRQKGRDCLGRSSTRTRGSSTAQESRGEVESLRSGRFATGEAPQTQGSKVQNY